jgi:thiol-disulfide isomerase/thioredoxin
MLKWLIPLTLLTTLAQAATNEALEQFITKSVNQNPAVELKKFTVNSRERVEGLNGWDRVDFTINVQIQERKDSRSERLYTYKDVIAPQLITLPSEGDHPTVSDEQISTVAQQSVAGNPNVTLKSMRVVNRMPLKGVSGWQSVQLEFDLDAKQGESSRALTTTELWFVGKGVIAPELIRLPDGRSIKHSIKGDVTPEHTRADRRIAGNAEAKYELIVFSDPLCPACREVVPGLIELAQKHPDQVAIYYYHKPISALSPVLMKGSLALKAAGQKGMELALYKKEFDVQSPDEMAVLEAFNKAFGSDLSLSDINSDAILHHMNEDARASGELLIMGTPTIFVNGEFDEDHSRIEAIEKELR